MMPNTTSKSYLTLSACSLQVRMFGRLPTSNFHAADRSIGARKITWTRHDRD